LTVTVLGAGGTMGFPMTQRLARSGYEVRAWNRSRTKAEPLAADGATVVESPAEALSGADVLITMLSNADAVLDSVSEIAANEVLWLQMSTVGEDGTRRCASRAEQLGMRFVDAPVTGTKEQAEKGELVILASGPEDVKATVGLIMAQLSQRVFWVGEAGAGTRMKLAANAWMLCVVESMAEVLAFASGLGLDASQLLDVIRGGPMDSPYLQARGPTMLSHDFSPSFKLTLAAKDAALIDGSAGRHGLDLPVLRTVASRLEEGVGLHGDDDVTATFLTSRPIDDVNRDNPHEQV
jgi:3-hydroxyisobutyrate dehydrogenase